MAEGRGYSGSQPASRVECGQWSPQQESPVPMSTYIVVDGSQFCSAELQRGCGHTNGGAGEGDQVREVLTVIHIFRQASFLTR